MKMKISAFLIGILLTNFIYSQTKFRAGYIIDLDGKKTEGLVELLNIQDPAGFFEQVIFKTRKNDKPQTYLPDQLQEFGLGESMIFRSFDVPMLSKVHIVTDEKLSRKFLRQLNYGRITFYELRREGRYASFFYSTDGKTAFPLKVQQKPVKDTMLKKGKLTLPSGTVVNSPYQGAIFADGERLFYLNNGVYELIPDYRLAMRKQLGEVACELPPTKNHRWLTRRTIFNHLKTLDQCDAESDFPLNSGGTLFDVSLLLMGSPRPGVHSLYQNQSIGGEIEIKSMSFSPLISLAFGHFRHDEGNQSYTEIIVTQTELRTDTIIETVNGSSNLIRLGYHMRPRKNFRPFLYAGFQFHNLKGTKIDTQEKREIEAINPRHYSPLLGGGFDFYFLKSNQFRVRAGYANRLGLEYYVGYGLHFSL